MGNGYGWDWFIKQFELISKIDLTSYKRAQMERRILSFMKTVDTNDYDKFIALIRADAGIYRRFIEHLTINVSEFFRNPNQWEVLEKTIIPSLLLEKKPLRVWSAGCSTGEEAYSLSMLFKEKFKGQVETILATDLDNEVLDKAMTALYTGKAVQTLPALYRDRYMVKDGDYYRVTDEIKKMVKFQRHNLLRDPFSRNFDLILCRNVVIYFTEESKNQLYRKFAEALRTGGILFIGSTEQIFQSRELGFTTSETFFYKKT